MSLSTQMCAYCRTLNRSDAIFCNSCGQFLSSDFPVSQTRIVSIQPFLKQRYRLVNQIAQGGMGTIYRAEDTLFNNALRAVKDLRLGDLRPQDLPAAIAAFKQEAMLLASLRHQNLPRIYDYFEENNYWYLVMDFIDGQTLESLLTETGGRLLAKDTLTIGIQICTVLDYLHTHRPPIIFRDLKPANIMITVDEHIYLIDFGIARIFKPGQKADTEKWGTKGYAPPEQYGNTQTDARADIFALGAVLYQLLSGYDPTIAPFRFPPLHLSKQSPIAALEPLIARMVSLERENRPARVQEVKQELLDIQNRLDRLNSSFLVKRCFFITS